MKKIIIVIILLTLTGCNYQELNDMAIVSLLGIKYQDNTYYLTIETENQKQDKSTSITYYSKGNSLETAIKNAEIQIDKNLYFINLNVILIDTDTINQKLIYITDYFTRNATFSINSNILIDDNFDQTINTLAKNDKIAGKYIKDILDSQNNNTINSKYQYILKNFLNKNQDIILPIGKVQDNQYIINEAYLFNNDKITTKISYDMIQIYNLLINEKAEYLFTINYQNKDLTYQLTSHQSKIKYQNNKINIKLNIDGSFIEIDNLNLNENANTLIKIIKNKINDEITNLLTILKTTNSDILKLRKYYYNTTRTKLDTINNIDYKIDISIKLDRNGLIFNSIGDMYEK